MTKQEVIDEITEKANWEIKSDKQQFILEASRLIKSLQKHVEQVEKNLDELDFQFPPETNYH